MACSSGGISRSSKILVIFVPVGPRAAGPGITAGAGLTSTAFSCGFDCVVEPLLSVLAFSVGRVPFSVFSSGFFGSDTGADLNSVGFSDGFCGTPGFFPSASIFSVGASVFGVSSGFFCSGAGFSSAFFPRGFSGVTDTCCLHQIFPQKPLLSAFPPAFRFWRWCWLYRSGLSDGFGCVTGVLFSAALSDAFCGCFTFLADLTFGQQLSGRCAFRIAAQTEIPRLLFPSYHR